MRIKRDLIELHGPVDNQSMFLGKVFVNRETYADLRTRAILAGNQIFTPDLPEDLGTPGDPTVVMPVTPVGGFVNETIIFSDNTDLSNGIIGDGFTIATTGSYNVTVTWPYVLENQTATLEMLVDSVVVATHPLVMTAAVTDTIDFTTTLYLTAGQKLDWQWTGLVTGDGDPVQRLYDGQVQIQETGVQPDITVFKRIDAIADDAALVERTLYTQTLPTSGDYTINLEGVLTLTALDLSLNVAVNGTVTDTQTFSSADGTTQNINSVFVINASAGDIVTITASDFVNTAPQGWQAVPVQDYDNNSVVFGGDYFYNFIPGNPGEVYRYDVNGARLAIHTLPGAPPSISGYRNANSDGVLVMLDQTGKVHAYYPSTNTWDLDIAPPVYDLPGFVTAHNPISNVVPLVSLASDGSMLLKYNYRFNGTSFASLGPVYISPDGTVSALPPETNTTGMQYPETFAVDNGLFYAIGFNSDVSKRNIVKFDPATMLLTVVFEFPKVNDMELIAARAGKVLIGPDHMSVPPFLKLYDIDTGTLEEDITDPNTYVGDVDVSAEQTGLDPNGKIYLTHVRGKPAADFRLFKWAASSYTAPGISTASCNALEDVILTPKAHQILVPSDELFVGNAYGLNLSVPADGKYHIDLQIPYYLNDQTWAVNLLVNGTIVETVDVTTTTATATTVRLTHIVNLTTTDTVDVQVTGLTPKDDNVLFDGLMAHTLIPVYDRVFPLDGDLSLPRPAGSLLRKDGQFYLMTQPYDGTATRVKDIPGIQLLTTGIAFVNPYNPERYYEPGDLCLIDGVIQYCKTPVLGPLDPTQWYSTATAVYFDDIHRYYHVNLDDPGIVEGAYLDLMDQPSATPITISRFSDV